MKLKEYTMGLISGVLISSVIVIGAQYSIYENPYRILVNGVEKYIQGYNIDDYSYFKLRDISDVVGGFNVDFKDNMIQLSSVKASDKPIDYDKYIGTYKRLGGTLGFYWILEIERITDEGIIFSYTYEKPGTNGTIGFAFFQTPNIAVCYDTETTYTITLREDRIIFDEVCLSENASNHLVFTLD